jgi:hypothetical protein
MLGGAEMTPRVISMVTGCLVLPVTLTGLCLMPGCGESNETGTVITKPPAVAEAEKKAMEGNKKAMMKALAGQKQMQQKK